MPQLPRLHRPFQRGGLRRGAQGARRRGSARSRAGGDHHPRTRPRYSRDDRGAHADSVRRSVDSTVVGPGAGGVAPREGRSGGGRRRREFRRVRSIPRPSARRPVRLAAGSGLADSVLRPPRGRVLGEEPAQLSGTDQAVPRRMGAARRERNALWMANPGARRITRLYQPDFAARVAGIDATRALGCSERLGSARLIDRVLRADLGRYLRTISCSRPTSRRWRSVSSSGAVPRSSGGGVRRRPASRWKVRGSGGSGSCGRSTEDTSRERAPGPQGRLRDADRSLVPRRPQGAGARPPARRGALSREYLRADSVGAVLKIHRMGQRNYDEMIWTLLSSSCGCARGAAGRRARPPDAGDDRSAT